MNKISVLTLIFLCLAAGAFAQKIDVSAGVEVNYLHGWYYDTYDNDNFTIQSFPLLAFGAYFDVTYARLSLGFCANLAKGSRWTSILGWVSDTTASLDEWRISNLLISLTAKYPFKLGPITVYPTVGVRYTPCLYYDYNGDGTSDLGTGAGQYDSLSDFYLLMGGGVEIKAGPFNIGLEVIFDLNLTPTLDTGAPTANSYSMNNLQAGIYAGYRF